VGCGRIRTWCVHLPDDGGHLRRLQEDGFDKVESLGSFARYGGAFRSDIESRVVEAESAFETDK